MFQIFDYLRHLPRIFVWIFSGFSGIAPPPIKRLIIKCYLKKYKLSSFIETGILAGDTLAYISRNSKIQCQAIELSKAYFLKAKQRFLSFANVKIYFGDSGVVLPELVKKLDKPTLFWLDGHFSSGDTAKGLQNTPISQELDSILRSPIRGHVILIDDIRHFRGAEDYPHLHELLITLNKQIGIDIEISTDILRLTPKKN